MHHLVLQQRFRDSILAINDTLTGMALDPRLMPGVASDMRLRSSASTPSLRSREGSVTPMGRMDAPPGGNVRVVVRVRGFLPREIERGAECLIEMNPNNQATTLLVPNDSDPANSRSKTRKVVEEKVFTFDNSFWSHDKKDEHYAHQEDVYNCLGEEFLDHNFEGYHTCIFAYGQTGSGKSYTMMGTPDQPGLIPRTCEDLFQRIEAAHNETPNISYNVRVSYFEVYNEHVRDLLVPVNPNQPPYYLKIRESPTEGPYIKDLTDAPVKNISEIMRHMKIGDASRTTASTKMNDTSSRSHSVFTIMLKQIHHDMDTDETTERMARIRLVDLAGSERAKATEATGARLREGSNINKSLTTLGRVIAALADPKQQRPGKRNKDVVPYRDSILTWLLKDSLGGNSKTAMIACIAPSDYDETLSTLRYADQAKRIRTRAIVNQDHVSAAERDAQIAAMAEEIRVLQLSVTDTRRREKEGKEQEEKLEEYQNRVVTMQRMMEERSMVAEGKIRNLQTENDALRLHLKLALDSLKNPIEVKSARSSVQGGSRKGSMFPDAARDVDKENQVHDEADDLTEVPDDEYGDDDEGIDVTAHEERANEVQGFMKELLSDLGMFKKKIGDDKARFINPLGERVN
ncbi:Kinesin-like protein [Lachnellula arida]|uniref:Kinesin-like protein n=2 Tax=Lachnellula TaxID=47830 RepID=A0A8T9BII8_9HELO|nr:Kinesin-like protein [Lachnellula arida]TVY92269.1 Kinesin-like protein [Lachnellula willkommii]